MTINPNSIGMTDINETLSMHVNSDAVLLATNDGQLFILREDELAPVLAVLKKAVGDEPRVSVNEHLKTFAKQADYWMRGKDPRPNADLIAEYIGKRWPHLSDADRETIYQLMES